MALLFFPIFFAQCGPNEHNSSLISIQVYSFFLVSFFHFYKVVGTISSIPIRWIADDGSDSVRNLTFECYRIGSLICRNSLQSHRKEKCFYCGFLLRSNGIWPRFSETSTEEGVSAHFFYVTLVGLIRQRQKLWEYKHHHIPLCLCVNERTSERVFA